MLESAHLRLRKLEEVGYVESVQIDKKRYAWQIGKRGYDFIRMHFSEDIHHGYKSEYPYHDYITTAFHLGEWLCVQPEQTEVYSEQELRCNPDEFWPEWIPQSTLHRPDGYSRIIQNDKQMLFAFETELSLKSKRRYEGLVYFYERQTTIDCVLWVVGSRGMMGSIRRVFERYNATQFTKHNFILLSDFLASGWQAPILQGNYKGKSLENLLGYCATTTPSLWHHSRSVLSLLDTKRCPSKSAIYIPEENQLITNRVPQP